MPEEMRHTLTQCGTKYFVALTARIIMELFIRINGHAVLVSQTIRLIVTEPLVVQRTVAYPPEVAFPLSVTKPDPPHHVRARCKKSSFPLIH